jgi:hypothetical protein
VSHPSLFTLVVVAAALGLASCGSQAVTPTTTESAAARGPSFVPVASACQTSGGSALLPGSNGRDAAAVPDDTPAVCGCWVRWMQAHLSAADQDAVVTGAALSASVMSLTDPATLNRLAAALRSCEPRPFAARRMVSGSPADPPSPGP